MTKRDRYEGLSDEQRDEVNRIRSGFESAWRNHEQPAIETLVQQASPAIRSLLLLELVSSEIELRAGTSQTPKPEDYKARFPNLFEPIQAIFADIEARTPDVIQQATVGLPGSDRSQALRHSPAEDVVVVPGSQIGPYRMEQAIGEGGMGSVWIAEQERPVKRTVAVKIIKPGMDSQQVIARFEAERQALAMMDHPNIAQVLDAGTTQSGRPYFVMELVRGIPITSFCDQNKLDVRKRLELFRSVCNAVQHAHQKGIIHRDLKPSNILVAEYDGKPVAKVIDFGLAKALFKQLTDETLHTQLGQVVGTLAYMSPEQSDANELDVDTRTDIYSLGVVLYELLTGTTPFEKQRLRSAAIDVVLKMIREEDPPKPSLRLSTEESSAEIAHRRGTETRRLSGIIRGDLDWIVMKALEKERNRRYESASEFGLDVERYLEGAPVIAAPPSAVYRLKKFVRRNRAAVGTVSAVVASLLIGVAAFAWQAQEARHQRDLALDAQEKEAEQRQAAYLQRDRAEVAEEEARQRADELQLVSDFQAQMLEQIDTAAAGRRLSEDVLGKFEEAIGKDDLTDSERDDQAAEFREAWRRVNATDAARQLIDRTILTPSIDAIEDQFDAQPAVKAQLLQTIANIYRDIGLPDVAFPLQTLAYELRLDVLGEDDPETIYSLTNLGILLENQGKLDEAEPYYAESLEKRRQVLGEEHPDTLISINNMGYLRQSQGRLDEAEVFYQDALEKRRRVLGEDDELTIASISNLGFLLYAQGKYQAALPFWTDTLEKSRRILGEDHASTLSAISNLGSLYRNLGRFDEAETLLLEALEKRRRTLGEEHPETLSSLNNLGFLLVPQGRLDESEPYFREALEKRRRVLGENHPSTLTSINNLGYVLREQGRLAEAEPLFVETLAARQRLNGDEHPSTLGSMLNLAALYRMQEKLEESEALNRDALEIYERTLGTEHPNTLRAMTNLASVLKAQDEFEEAAALARSVLEIRQESLDAEHPDVLGTTHLLGSLLQVQGESQATMDLLAPIEQATRVAFTGSNAHQTATYLLCLGKAEVDIATTAAAFVQAERHLLESYEIFGESPGPVTGGQAECASTLVRLYTAWDLVEPDKGLDGKAKEWSEK